MSTLRSRFERLEPRILLSGAELLRGGLDPTAAPIQFSPAVAQPDGMAAVGVEERAKLMPSQPVEEAVAPPLVIDRPLVEEPPAAGQAEVSAPMQPEPEGTSDVPPGIETQAAVTQAADERGAPKTEPEPSGGLSSSADATRATDAVSAAAAEPIVAGDLAPTGNATQVSADVSVAVSGRKLTAVAVEARPAAEQPSVKPGTSATERLSDRQEESARTDADAGDEADADRGPTAAGSGENATSQTDAQTEVQADKRAADAGTSAGGDAAGAAGRPEIMALAGQLAAGREARPAEATGPPEKSTAAAGHSDAPQPAATTRDAQPPVWPTAATSSDGAAQQSGGGTVAAGLADQVFATVQVESDCLHAAATAHGTAQGALLAVTLGKPLSRLVGGDHDGQSSVDGGSLSLPVPRAGSQRSRRKTGQSQGRWLGRKDARNSTSFLPERRPARMPETTGESAGQQADEVQPAAMPVSPRLADLAILSCLAASAPEDGCQPPQSPGSAPSWGDVWESGEWIVTLAGGAMLSGAISWLAIDRCRHAATRPRPLAFRPPAYTGQTLARAL